MTALLVLSNGLVTVLLKSSRRPYRDVTVMVVVAVDMVVIGGWVMVIVGWGSAGGTVVREVVPVFCDPASGGSSGGSMLIGVMSDFVGPTPSLSGTGLIVYHLFASSTAMYTQR